MKFLCVIYAHMCVNGNTVFLKYPKLEGQGDRTMKLPVEVLDLLRAAILNACINWTKFSSSLGNVYFHKWKLQCIITIITLYLQILLLLLLTNDSPKPILLSDSKLKFYILTFEFWANILSALRKVTVRTRARLDRTFYR